MMNRELRVLACLVLSLGITLAPERAHAQPTVAPKSDADKETARQLIDSGKKKLDVQDYDGAIKAYRAAHDLMGVPTTALYLARAQEANGLLIEARQTALNVARIPVDPSEPTVITNARAEAATLASSLIARIPSLVITVHRLQTGVAPTVTVNSVAVPVSTLGLPWKVNPGTYTVAASASGYTTASVIVMAKETEQVQVPLTMVRAPVAPSSAAPPPAAGSSAAPPPGASPPAASKAAPPAGSSSTAPLKSTPAMDLPPIAPPPANRRTAKEPIYAVIVEPKPPQPEPTWYGWQNVLSLGLSTALAVPAALGIASEDASPGWYVMAAFAGSGLAFGGPIVHWSHGNVGKGFGSLALNLGLTGGGGAIGYGIIQALEDDGTSDLVGVGIGAGIGYFFATLIDVGSLSFEKKADDAGSPPGQKPIVGVAPVVDLQDDRRVFGLACRFH